MTDLQPSLPLFQLREIDGILCQDKFHPNIQYLGKIQEQQDGTWRSLADVNGLLYLVEVKVELQS